MSRHSHDSPPPRVQFINLLGDAWHDEQDDIAAIACKTLYNYLLGWHDGGDGRPLDYKPRFTVEQCVTLLHVLDDVIGDDEDDSGGGDASDSKAGGTSEVVAVARKLRGAVQEVVQAGAVATTTTSASAATASSSAADGAAATSSASELEPLEP